MIQLFLFLLGLLFMIAGAELLVRGASRLAAALGVPSLVVGLTVVAFGTSAPELAVSLKAAMVGQASIALGNVIGSNIFNVLFILGVSALIVPLVVASQLVRREVPLMIGLSALVALLALDGGLGRLDGLLLSAGLVVYTVFLVRQGRKQGAEEEEPHPGGPSHLRNAGFMLVGLVLLVLGSRWLVDGAVAFASRLGIGEMVIGLTIVAAGTSLPEVVTSILAATKGERDIAVGNVVGSNLFNLMGVLGVAALAAPEGVTVSPAAIRFDLPVMIAVAFACLPIFFTGGRVSRGEGALLLGYYLVYTAFLILAASQRPELPVFGFAMLAFVLPLTGLTLAIVVWRQWSA